MKTNQCSIRTIGKAIRAQHTQVKAWMEARALPNLVFAFRIDQYTKGGVPASSWLGTPLGRNLWHSMGTDWDEWAKKIERSKQRKEAKDGAPTQEG